MTYRIQVQKLAKADLAELAIWIANKSSVAALRWLDKMLKAIGSLQSFPTRCAISRESRRNKLELRELLVGKRPYVYRIVFLIEADLVRVLRVLRTQRSNLTAAQIKRAIEFDE